LPLFWSCQFRRLDSFQFLCSQVHIPADWPRQVKVTLRLTVSQSVSKSWCRAPSWTHDQIFSYNYLTVTVLFLWGALSDEGTGLSFVYAAGSSQRSLSRVRVPWYSRPYFTVSGLRLPIYDSQGHGGGIRPSLHTPKPLIFVTVVI
jgi:hypothetical protein